MDKKGFSNTHEVESLINFYLGHFKNEQRNETWNTQCKTIYLECLQYTKETVTETLAISDFS